MANLLSTSIAGQLTVNSGRLLLQTGGVNTYGIVSGYNNNNHFITMRGSVSGSTSSPTFGGAHQMTFVEYAEAGDSTGWYFKSSSSGTYEEIARITRSGINWSGNNVIHSGGGQTINGITYFSNGESLSLYGIRGRFTNEYIHLYEKVGIGHPGGWGQGEANTPTQGLSIYGGINIAYARDNGATINTYTRINKNWAGGDYGAEQFTIRGTYPSITLRSTQHNNVWLIHNDDNVSFYYGSGVDSNNWSRRFFIPTDGNIWMSWAGDYLSNLLNAKQNASTAITTSNIGSQSVNYASSAGNADTLDGYHSNTVGNRHHTARGFYVDGDQNTYYPVLIQGSGNYAFNRYSIYRFYGWEAPWDPIGTGAHRGGLTFDVEWSGDIAWGGNDKTLRVVQFAESYTTMVAGMALPVTGGLCVWLRGGHAYYEIQVDAYPTTPTVYLDGFTAANGAFYGPRADTNNVQSEIYNRMPVRGSSELYDGGSRVITSGNIGSQSVNYASSAGNSDTLDSLDSSEFARGRAAYQVLNLDTIKQPGLYQYDGGIGGTQPEGADQANLRTIEIGSGGRYSQMAFDWNSEQAWFRRQTGSTWSAWREFIHSGNISSQSVSYATSAGDSTNLGGYSSARYVRNDIYNSVDAGLQVFRNIGTIDGSWPSSDHTLGLENSDAGTIVVNFHRAGYTSNNLWYNGSQFRFDTVVSSTADFRAPIFYDSDDTTFYGDFNSRSVLNSLQLGTAASDNSNLKLDVQGNMAIRGANGLYFGVSTNSYNSWTTRIYASGSTQYFSGQQFIFDNQGYGTQTFASFSSQEALFRTYPADLNYKISVTGGDQFNAYYGSGAATLYLQYHSGNGGALNVANGKLTVNTAGSVVASGDMRAPIFYDSNDTGYYLDPNSTSRLYRVNSYYLSNAADVSDNHPYGIYFASSLSDAYGIFRESGTWTYPYPDLRIAFHTGIKIGANATYEGVRFYTDYDMSTQVMSVNNGSDPLGGGNVYVNNSLQAGSSLRAPIFYDSNDTTYYLDPSNTLKSLNVAGNIDLIARSASWAEGIRVRVPSTYTWGGIRFTRDRGDDDGNWAIGFTGIDSTDDLTFWGNTGGNGAMRMRLDHSSNLIAYGSMRAPIFYAVGNTNYFWEPNVNNAHRFRTANGYVEIGPMNSSWCHFQTDRANFYFGSTIYADASGFATYGGSTSMTKTDVNSPMFLVTNHSDNTKGYRIQNTSGTSVSAMFTNSSNQLVIAAGALDQINLNKKVYVNGVALGVNVAPSATAGRIDASNDIVAYSSSDERLKENITPIENALDKVKSLTGVEFDWKPEYKHAHGYEGHDTGIIAQQVEAVMPSAVRTNDTGFLAVRYEKLIGLLIEGMKEQQAQIDELKAKLDGLTK